jgi:hypothetical protein
MRDSGNYRNCQHPINLHPRRPLGVGALAANVNTMVENFNTMAENVNSMRFDVVSHLIHFRRISCSYWSYS